MKCPTCPEVSLVITDRQGVEIDYCPECRGVWLDRGELDKIIERSAESPLRSSRDGGRQSDQRRPRYEDDRRYNDRRDDDRRYEDRGRRRKKSSAADFLSDIFDFD